ncbi:hypothetical protein ASPCAL06506 [Aspergillus calidoustus]|uniref:VWFA domain-containing protein n=1 Tax=Aspergillus calidoustus TaxID=454130 RepID=A0A0U5C926_ASPCI|nr:hypothetical protein ASPCAL06506 [Aspergillus calidoustus]
MGFASKIANAQMNNPNSGVYGGAAPAGYTGGPPPAGGGSAGGQTQQQQPPSQQQQQSQYQAYPGGSAGGYPPQNAPYPGGYPPQNSPYPGAPPRAPQGPPPSQYGPPGGGAGAAGPATPQQLDAYRQLLIATIQEKNLQNFYPPAKLDRLVQGLARDGPSKINRIVNEFSLPIEIAMDVIKLSLYDIVLYVDDSGSIEFEEKGVRKEQLKQIIGIVATIASTFDEDGINVRFMNNELSRNGIRSVGEVEQLIASVRFSGMTPLGTGLKNKVLDPLIVGPARANQLQKPVLVITITDGQPAGEPLDSVAQGIRYAVDEVGRSQYGRGAVAFQFSQVGNDTKARDFLGSLDNDPSIGGFIDCTSNFEVEQDEMSRASPPVHLTRELWCAKLMLGSIDASYDTKDEKGSRPSGAPSGPPPPGQYGGYGQPGGYPGQPPSGPPPGQYGGYPNQPPAPGYGSPAPYNQGQQQYGQQQYPPSSQAPGGYGQQPPAPNYGGSPAPYNQGQQQYGQQQYPPSSQAPGGYGQQPPYGQQQYPPSGRY